ncbi:hypothetical protein M1403_02395 [Patescibacteria group bacterium]|nr:hypothetical protein [Patescibacteria group bacterium]
MATSSNSARYRRYFAYIQPVLTDPVVRSYFALIASLILITFLILFALSPTINIILGLRKKIDDQNRILKALNDKVNALVLAEDVYQRISPQLPLLETALPTEPQPQDLIFDLHKTATAAGVTLSGLQFEDIPLSTEAAKTAGKTEKKAVTVANLPTVNFSLAVNGTELQTRDFLGRLENQLRYIRLSSLSFSWIESQAGGLSINVSGQGYYYRSQ